MENIEPGFKAVGRQNKIYFLAALVLIIFALLCLYFFNNGYATQLTKAHPEIETLSQEAFMQQYGLRVNLLAVTAAGGMVDLRLKIVDGERAKALLQDKANYPALQINNGGLILNASDDAKSQEIQFVSGENLFLLYSNQGNAVKPGTFVTLLFGDTALEPIEVK